MTDLCVVLGAPRSGTTWLQRLLAASPHVASPQETNLFDLYLSRQWRRWERQERHLARALDELSRAGEVENRVTGLPTILEEVDLLDSQRLLLDRLLRRATAAKPGARLVLEKTPSNSLSVQAIDRVCPDARFVHIVRDPRDVMASLRDAAVGWGDWAPRSSIAAAHLWLRHYRGARSAADFGPLRYLEVRYEDLRAHPTEVLGQVLAHLDLPDAASDLVRADESNNGSSFDQVFVFRPELAERLRKLPGSEPSGFRSSGRRPLDPVDLQVAEAVVGSAAREAGYLDGWPRHGSMVGSTLLARARAQDLLVRIQRRRRPRGAGPE